MKETDYDILIIGGGIYGCGIAQAVSACGYQTILIEQKQLASATSSQSTKLIHGGLRYLEQFNLKLVYEGLSEREQLLKLAPDLVSREWFHIPVYEGNKRPPWMIAAGLLLYFILSGGRSRFRWLPKAAWAGQFPELNKEGLKAILAYEDAATDDAALTRAVARSAQSFGCSIREEVIVERAIYLYDHWRIWLSTDEEITARIVVNAGGPWVNRIADIISPTPPTMGVHLVQGSHLLLDRKCPGFIYTESLDGRVMFFRPWKGRTLAGTTETPFEGDPAKVEPTEREVHDILTTYNHYFPDMQCSNADVIETYCGLRVLPQTEGIPFAASRETVILCDDEAHPAYLAIYGGKLTTYRKESAKVLKLITRSIDPPHPRNSKHIPIK